jgi:alpha-amylase
VQLHDYSGHHADVWTNEQGMVSITVPPNDNGKSYVCFSRVGYAEGFTLNPRTTTQTFFGAIDLDTGPANNGQGVQVGRIWCQSGTRLNAAFNPDTTQWGTTGQTVFEVVDSSARTLATQNHRGHGMSSPIDTIIQETGWHTLRVTGQALPAAGAPYEAIVTYTGTQQLP